ncbi:MAG: alkaline phosphatase [Puia sp.]|nr:alkaline phosphatase [Puia sp.]
MYKLFVYSCLMALVLASQPASGQPLRYSVANAHSHNDYEQATPFRLAYDQGFGSIEADIFLVDGQLLVAHEEKELQPQRTLEKLYLEPILACLSKNGGHVYADSTRSLQLLIDIKTDSIHTLDKLVETIRRYPPLINCPTLKFAITGNRPDPGLFSRYPDFIRFDGELYRDYDKAALDKIIMLSDDFERYSRWNGKGRIPPKDRDVLQAAITKAHVLDKPVRFWDAPDFINVWQQLIGLRVDYINTDHIEALSVYLNKLSKTSYTSPVSGYTAYRPTYRSDGLDRPVKNVILLIGDGTGLAQLYAGYTANRGTLNIFKMRQIGLSKTSSFDNYVTDSAPGSTAFSSGVKTNNRYVGVDHTGAVLPLLPVFLARKSIRTGLVTCGDIADATPADFYAHQPERDNAAAILRDLGKEPIDILMGSGDESLNNVEILKEGSQAAVTGNILKELESKYTIVASVDSVRLPGPGHPDKKWIVVEKRAGLSMLHGRGDWLSKAFNKTLSLLSAPKPGSAVSPGFFIMTEGAQVDYGGHANDLPYVATEVLDFDQVVGEALRFADQDGQTLVIVTADHETGGLSLLDGNYEKGMVSGQFSTNDHSGIPVPVFAYGPRSGLFRGVYENTEIFGRILKAYGLR